MHKPADELMCPVCGSDRIVVVKKYPYHNPLFSECSIVRCENCRMVFVQPMPDEKTLEAYNAGYFENAHGGISENKLTIAFHSAINLLRVLHVEAFQKKTGAQIKNVLEIGPGGGHFARHWLQRNPGTENYTAIESDTSCHAALIDLGMHVYTDTEQLSSEQVFDLVVISHVLEHTSHPKKFIQDCTRPLQPGGILFIEVPCNDYQHKDVIEPHLLFFDKDPMKLFLHETGFGQVSLSYHGETIMALKKKLSSYQNFMKRFRNALLSRNIVFPFSAVEPGLENVPDALERAVVKPFEAHIEHDEPSWWLRALSVKK